MLDLDSPSLVITADTKSDYDDSVAIMKRLVIKLSGSSQMKIAPHQRQ